MEGTRALTADEIKARWDLQRDQSAVAGAWTHLQCECVFNGGYIEDSCQEMDLLKTFLGNVPPLLAYRAEWCVWADEEQIAGMIDFVATDMNGRLLLLGLNFTFSFV